MIEPLDIKDIDRADHLALHVAESLKKGSSMDDLWLIHTANIAIALADVVVIHGVERIHKLLDALRTAVNTTNGEQIHDAFLMALDMKTSLDNDT